MLILDAPAQLLADIHMIQSLAVAVKEICVSLCLRDLGSLININKTGCLDESLEGCNGGKFVKVTGGNDVSLFVLLEDLCNKVLQVVSWVLCIMGFILTAVISDCLVRFSTPLFTGVRASPCREVEPPLLPKWTLTVKKDFFVPLTGFHSATRGLRLSSQAGLAGSIRPGLYLSDGPSTTALTSLGPP